LTIFAYFGNKVYLIGNVLYEGDVYTYPLCEKSRKQISGFPIQYLKEEKF